MKHVYAILLLVFPLCGLTHAQFIAENSVITAAGDGSGNAQESPACRLGPAPAAPWQKGADQVFGHIRGSLLARLKNTSEDIIWTFHDSILPEAAFHPIWHGEYFAAGNGAPQLRFGISCVFRDDDGDVNGARGHNVYPSGNASADSNDDVHSKQPGDLTIFANDISPLFGSLTVNGQVFVTLKGFTGGSPAFEFDMPAGNDEDTAAVHVKAWLVTADSSVLPYVPVTRKEYLEGAREELRTRRDAIVADLKSRILVRPAAQQDAAKQQALDQLRSTYSGMELETRTRIFLNNYVSDEAYAEQNIAAATVDIDRPLALIEKLLSGSTAQQLAQPAVVSVPGMEFRGFEDGRPNSVVLVRLRGAYYGADTDQLTVKSLLICWRYHPADKIAEDIDHELSMRNPVPVLRKQFYNASIAAAQ